MGICGYLVACGHPGSLLRADWARPRVELGIGLDRGRSVGRLHCCDVGSVRRKGVLQSRTKSFQWENKDQDAIEGCKYREGVMYRQMHATILWC